MASRCSTRVDSSRRVFAKGPFTDRESAGRRRASRGRWLGGRRGRSRAPSSAGATLVRAGRTPLGLPGGTGRRTRARASAWRATHDAQHHAVPRAASRRQVRRRVHRRTAAPARPTCRSCRRRSRSPARAARRAVRPRARARQGDPGDRDEHVGDEDRQRRRGRHPDEVGDGVVVVREIAPSSKSDRRVREADARPRRAEPRMRPREDAPAAHPRAPSRTASGRSRCSRRVRR